MAADPYESERLLAEYLLFHYGAPDEILPWSDGPAGALNFPVRSVRELLPSGISAAAAPGGAGAPRPFRRALDLGCAVGRSTFELSTLSEETIGIDFSASFVAAAERLRRTGEVPFRIHDEGHCFRAALARRPDGVDPADVRFETGDAEALRADLGEFDLVHAANLVCRLGRPRRLLERLPDLVAPGGLLLLATPCTWLGEFTPPEDWPEGSTLEWLRECLRDRFVLEQTRDLPFLIRETARKFQWTVAQGSQWRRLGR